MIVMSTLTFRKSFILFLYVCLHDSKYIIHVMALQGEIVYMDKTNKFLYDPIKGRMPSKENLYLAFIMKKF